MVILLIVVVLLILLAVVGAWLETKSRAKNKSHSLLEKNAVPQDVAEER